MNWFDTIRSFLKLDFLDNWRTLAGVLGFLVLNAVEGSGIDVPGYEFIPWGNAVTLALTALGIYGAVKKP